ncbi:hypothetical protein [uncultured Enorma sp.]|uniref:DUF7724 family protein n=1 Tax=uncultured Enorma sp. TaxID=1714346 RepID=UPI002635940C|nr:hypothetical protein [uncultured Enorma sp.]
MSSANDTALLSVSDGFTLFAYGDHRIRFKTPARLKRYLAVKQWDAGYLVADAEYDGVADPVEEYAATICTSRRIASSSACMFTRAMPVLPRWGLPSSS